MKMAAARPKQLCVSLLLLLLASIHLCSQLALSHSLVKFLPGFQGPLPFELETGYVGVDESEDVQIFYYFVKSETKPRQDPLILWLTGGPCCSSFTGLIYEIGPLYFKEVRYNGSLPTLELNSNSWTKTANIIFVDLPVGTGFSYARTSRAARSFDLQLCDQAHQFLRKWLNAHPEYISNPLYVGGDSYSGITVPIIAQVISSGKLPCPQETKKMNHNNSYKCWRNAGNEGGTEQFNINLRGYILGNPVTFPDEGNYAIPFSHGMGLISDELYECTGTLNQAHILEINCGLDYSPKPLKLFNGRRSLYERFQELHTHTSSPLSAFSCRVDGYWLSYHWMNDESVREALHVRKLFSSVISVYTCKCKEREKEAQLLTQGSKGTWIRCNHGLPYQSVILDSRPYHVNLSRKGYRSLIYSSGDHDMLVPFPSTQAWIRHLNYSIIDEWRPWNVHGQIAGYTRTYSNQMTFATVKVRNCSLQKIYELYNGLLSSTSPHLCFYREAATQLQSTNLKNVMPCSRGGYPMSLYTPRPEQLCFSLLLLLLASIHLCSRLALSHSLVKFLPGFQGPLPFELETGYVGVDESEDVQIFYYFVKSETKPRQDPLILWLTGGPGCSSFSGLIYEIGPLYFREVRYNGSLPTLELNPKSWTKMANIIFVDLPVGTGFSYARTSRAAQSSDLQLCDQAHEFLRKWLNAHPEYISNPFYIGGDSYSGITVPIIAQVISNGNEGGTEQFNINLKVCHSCYFFSGLQILGHFLGFMLLFPFG
ncbi:hypothetical protein RJ639_038368 [Escallonia herrerae]|uniref:Uncharacterized protein n=1 Tax=Escallonia herrerae TaxID=1293975 RepID=A0AA88X0S8_9ASTE|nr:hypothetical protein RJ639_038368 [Escallonia herrerae]